MAILIKNGLVYDGSGNPPEQKDILIRGKLIAKIGKLSRSHVDEVIDANGKMVTPGCIDVTTHSDHHYSLFYEPDQEDFLSQGITSIIGGNCGVSLAPLFGVLPDIATEWGSLSGINVNWKTVKEFLSYFEKRPLGVNFGTLVGYTGLRRGITRDKFRDLTDSEIVSINHIIGTAIKDGAFGCSFGLEHIHGVRTPFYEIEHVIRSITHHNGVSAIHLRNTGEGFQESVEECVEISERTGGNIHISHMQPLKKNGKNFENGLAYITEHANNTNIHFDINTFDTVPLLIYELLPEWAQEESFEGMYQSIRTQSFASRVIEYLKKNVARDYVISHVPDKTLKFLEGKSIRELASRAGTTFEHMVLHLMDITCFRATISAKIVDVSLLPSAITHPQSIISSNSASFGKKEFKATQSTNTVPDLFSFIQKNNIIALEKAVAKVTSIPAKKFGIEKRGVIAEGNYADIVVWSERKPVVTFVNGSTAWTPEHGCGGRYGLILKSKHTQ